MTRQTMIDTLGEARSDLQEGCLFCVLAALNDVRDALLDGDPEEDRDENNLPPAR